MTKTKSEKAELRAKMATFRRGLDPESVRSRSTEAAVHFFSLLERWEANRLRTFALYLPFPWELGTSEIWRELEARDLHCVFPRVERGSKILSFHPLRKGDPTAEGPLGIREPKGASAIPLQEIDVFLVPGAAFDEGGGRLGMGGGYYDSTLALAPAAKRVGYCFDEQVVESIPRAPHDAHVDWIVTPSRRIRCPMRMGTW